MNMVWFMIVLLKISCTIGLLIVAFFATLIGYVMIEEEYFLREERKQRGT